MSEKNTTPDDLNKYITLLLSTSLEIHDSAFGQSKQMFWFTCINKFYSLFLKLNDPNPFKPIFLKFYEDNKSFFDKPIFYDDDKGVSHVNDSILKNSDKNVETMSKSKDSWSPKEVGCKGIVIYYKPGEEKFKAISIPISEIYQCAVKIWKEKNNSDSNIRTYPGKILLSLYGIFKYVLDNDNDNVNKNFMMLSEFIEQISDNKSGKSNDTMSAISKAMASVIKETGMGGDINANELQAVLSTALTGDAAKNMTKILSQVMSSIETADTNNIQDVLSKVGSAMQTKEMADMASETLNQAQTIVDTIPGVKKMFNENGESSNTPQSNDVSVDPTTQE